MGKIYEYPFVLVGKVYRPNVPVIIYNPIDKKQIQVWALLDTGADACVFPKIIADCTGHNLKGDGVKQNINQGVGKDAVTAWKHTFIVHLLTPDKVNFAWSSQQMLVDCLEHDSAPPLLGWRDFMQNLNISFNYATKK